MTTTESPCSLLRRAADELQTASAWAVAKEQTHAGVGLIEGATEWAAMLAPPVADALAVWLRHTANAVWTYPPFLAEWKGGGDGEYHAGEAAKSALALARVLLGESVD